MNPRGLTKRIEIVFTHNNTPYRYVNGWILDMENVHICDADISHTSYKDNEDVIKICCCCALEAYERGKTVGITTCKMQIKEFLDV